MGLKRFIKKARKTSVGKLAGKIAAVQAGVLTGGLVKPKVLGIKNDRNQKIYRVTGNVTKVAAAVTLGAGAAGVGPAAGLFGKAVTQGGVAPSTGLAEKLKSFTEGGEMGFSTEVVRSDQETELRDFEVPTLVQSLKPNLPLILGGLALVGGLFWIGRGK